MCHSKGYFEIWTQAMTPQEVSYLFKRSNGEAFFPQFYCLGVCVYSYEVNEM